MKITVDTNILISATFWYGDSNRIIGLIEKKTINLVLSEEIIKEYAAVLKYDEIMNKIKNKRLEIKYSIQKIVSLSTIVKPKEKIDIIKDDPDDNKILECAKEGKVQFIITNDKHLLKIKVFEGIKIVTPKEFLKHYLLARFI